MKIAMLFAYWDGEPWSTPRGFMRELETRGHEITMWNCYHREGVLAPEEAKAGKVRQYSAEGLNLLVSHIRRGYQPDVIFHLDYGMYDVSYLNKDTFPSAIWVLEAGDEPQSHLVNRNKAPKFDITLSPDFRCTEIYKQAGLNAHFWTHCADTKIFKPYDDITEDVGVISTCGPRGYKDLKGVTEALAEALGDQYKNERYFWGADHGKFLNRGKIVFQCSQHREVTRRIFEGMACGKMVLTDRLPEGTHLEQLFEDGKDIVYYDSIEDAVAKAKYYLEHDDERKRIAANGMVKTWKDHSVTARIDYFEKVTHDAMVSKLPAYMGYDADAGLESDTELKTLDEQKDA